MTRRIRSLALLAASCLALASSGCVHGQCVASAPAVHGSVSACCGGEPRYLWTGTRCEADSACECDATPATPFWSSLQACEEKHHQCADFDAR